MMPLLESPRQIARFIAITYLLTLITGVFAQGFVSERLINFGDAAVTANNLAAHKGLFQLGFAVYLVEMACNIAMTSLFYDLLAPVSRSLSLLAAFIGLAGCVIKTVARLFFMAPLLVLGNHVYMQAFNSDQLQALALLLLRINDRGAAMALVFFGFNGLVSGYLIFKSGFLPRIFGVVSVIGSVGWLAFLYPPLGYRMFNYTALVGLLWSLALIGWLLIAGVNEQRWEELASRSENKRLSLAR